MEGMRRISNNYYFRQIVACVLVGCLFFNSVPAAFAGPGGANVVAGSAAVGQGGNTTTVTMGSAQAVINWDSLNTNSNEVLQFLKASGGFAVLNRIVQGGATQFDGSLFGNQGHILIVNPQGIVFGPTALVQAYKFTAAGLDISDTDFMNGHYQFIGGDGVGAVSNYGSISAEQVALIGKQVLNAGIISSPGGYVVMAAGDKVFLGQEDSNVLVEVEGVTVPAATDAAGIGDVINEGTIEAAGGKIVLAAGDTFSRAVEGLDSLSLAVESGNGRVGQFGTLNADGVEGDGGSITMTAGDVVALSSNSLTTANAGTNGDGGEVIAYSPETALFREGAQIQAKGGTESGDGGFIEVSGKNHVEINGFVNASASHGSAGTFLIDPTDITVQAGAGDITDDTDGSFTTNANTNTVQDTVIEGYLDAGTNVILDTSDYGANPGPYAGAGDITISAAIDPSAGSNSGDVTLTLYAADDIAVNAAIDGTGLGGSKLNVDLRANQVVAHFGDDPNPAAGDVSIGAAVTTAGGSFTSSGVDFDNTGGIITTGGGAIAVNHTGTVTLGADLDPGAGSMSGTATSINVASNLAEIQDAIDIAGGTTISVSDGTYNENLTVNKSDITLKSVNGPGSTTLTATNGVVVDVEGGGDNFTLGGASGEGFSIDSGANSTFLVQLANAPQDVEISWNELDTTGNASQGISVGAAGATGLNINNNDFVAGELVDGSIWGPYVVDVSVTDNTFTGPVAKAASGYAVQFAGVTGTSVIQDNIINDYGMGIAIFNGTGTSGLTIQGNSVTDSTTGIRLGQYSPGVNGDMDDVTITANTLTDNTTGLQINNGANVKPSGFSVTNNFFVNNTTGVESQHSSESATIYENSFSGNTTAVSNTGALAMLDAEGNWWGHATGPSGAGPGSGDAVSTKVDYSPWLGIGTDGDLGTPGFQMASPMTWWGNGSIQAIIDAASSGDTVNVVADTYVENVNVNKGLAGLNFMGASASEIQGDLELTNDSSNWDGGDLGISTQNQDLTLNSGTNHATTDTGDHSLTLDTGTATTYLQGEVTVGGDLTLMSNAESSEDMILEAGDSIYAHGTLTTTAVGPDDGFGNIELSASGSTIHLYGNVNADVTDDGDIILHSHSVIDDGVVLTAGKDVTNLGLMEAEGDLTIVATDGGIESADVLMKADGKTLSLTQNDSLNMENAFDDVINSDDTDLVADSTAGSFTETKAPRWQTIAADAQTYILLDDTDSPGNITTKALTTTDGDILITSNLGKVYATGPISAGNDVKITAKNEASDAIFLDKNVDAERDIWLNNNTWAADDVQIDAVQDVRVGWNEIQERYDPKTLTGDGDLRVEAGRHITLGGNVTADGYLELMADYDHDTAQYQFNDGVGDMTAHGSVETTNGYLHVIGKNIQIDGTVDAAGSIDMWAADNITLDNSVESDFYMQLYADWDPGIWDYDDDGIGPDVGDMWAKSTLDSLGGYIEIKAADSTINLDDDVTASTDILLRDNTVVAAGKTLDAGRDVTVGYGTADGTTLTGEGALTVEADRHITLGGAVDASSLTPANLVLWADKDNSGTPGGDMIAYGSLTNPGGDIEIHSADSTSELWDDVILSGDFVMYNDTEMKAAGKIIQSTGDDVILMGGKTLDSDYDLTIDAFDDIILGVTTIAFATHETTGGTGTAGDVEAAGDMTMTAGDAIYAHGTLKTTAGGDIELSALGSSTIHLYDDVEADIATDGDIILHSNTEVAAGKHLWAGQDITLDDGKSLNGDGSLDIFAERHITLGGPVAADGNMRLYADFDIGPDDFAENNIGKMHAKSSLTTTGTDSDLYVYGQDIQVDGDVDSSGDILMGAADDITLGDLVSEDSVTSVGDIYLLADLEASTIDPLNPQFDNADLDEDGVGKLWAKSTITLTGSDLYAYGQDIEVDGEVDSSGMVVMGAANSITLDEDVTAAGDMYLYADFDADAGVMGEFVEDSDGGDLVADGSLETTGTGNDIYAYGKNITVDGDVDSSGMIVMGAAHDITLGDDVLYDSVEAVGDIWLLADLDASNINPVDPQLTDNDYLDENGDGDVHAKSTITTTGSDVIVYGQNIEVDGYVDSSGMIVMGAANNITLDAWVKSVGDMYLYADLDADAGVMGEFVEGTDGGDMTADEYLQTTGSGSDIIVYGQNIRVDGDVTSNGDILMGAEDNITLGDLVSEDDVTAQGDIYLLADLDASNINPLAPDLPANTDFAEGGDGN
ncbi:MAG: NosD domain-containing protein, partial [Planctomycetota bacterium]